MNQFVNRIEELERLQSLYGSDNAEPSYSITTTAHTLSDEVRSEL